MVKLLCRTIGLVCRHFYRIMQFHDTSLLFQFMELIFRVFRKYQNASDFEEGQVRGCRYFTRYNELLRDMFTTYPTWTPPSHAKHANYQEKDFGFYICNQLNPSHHGFRGACILWQIARYVFKCNVSKEFNRGLVRKMNFHSLISFNLWTFFCRTCWGLCFKDWLTVCPYKTTILRN